MGRITNVLFAHPDEFLVVLGAVAGFGLGTANLGIVGGLVAGGLLALLTLVLAHLEPLDPALGPHQ